MYQNPVSYYLSLTPETFVSPQSRLLPTTGNRKIRHLDYIQLQNIHTKFKKKILTWFKSVCLLKSRLNKCVPFICKGIILVPVTSSFMKIGSLVYKLLGEDESTALLLLFLLLQPVHSKKRLHVWEANSVLFVGISYSVLYWSLEKLQEQKQKPRHVIQQHIRRDKVNNLGSLPQPHLDKEISRKINGHPIRFYILPPVLLNLSYLSCFKSLVPRTSNWSKSTGKPKLHKSFS
jgi:hypothetical protein